MENHLPTEKFDISNFDINTDNQVNINELKIGNIIYVNYYPMSQKYIDEYPSVLGKVFYIDDDNAYIYYNKNTIRTISQVILPGCSYGFVDSLGYDYVIYLQKN